MGEPDNLADYVAVVVGEWGRRYGSVYIPRDIWTSLRPQAREFTFYIPDKCRYRILFDRPVSRLQP